MSACRGHRQTFPHNWPGCKCHSLGHPPCGRKVKLTDRAGDTRMGEMTALPQRPLCARVGTRVSSHKALPHVTVRHAASLAVSTLRLCNARELAGCWGLDAGCWVPGASEPRTQRCLLLERRHGCWLAPAKRKGKKGVLTLPKVKHGMWNQWSLTNDNEITGRNVGCGAGVSLLASPWGEPVGKKTRIPWTRTLLLRITQGTADPCFVADSISLHNNTHHQAVWVAARQVLCLPWLRGWRARAHPAKPTLGGRGSDKG